MKLTRVIITLILINISFSSFGQEVRGLNYQPTLRAKTNKVQLKSTTTHEVPIPDDCVFFDDFTTYGDNTFPVSTNWLDQNATITYNFADSVISYGVVTLDCFDSKGRVNGTVGYQSPSDTLTSKQIILDDNSGYYLTYFIEGGGNGDAPEAKDSLVLEVMAPKSQEWLRAWSTPGFQSNNFKQIFVQINDSLTVDSTFQFRFTNYISLSAKEVQGNEGALSNSDNWHIDYIQVKKANDTTELKKLNDVALTKKPLSSLKEYSLIPYNHLQNASSYAREEIGIWYRTMFPERASNLDIGRSHIFLNTDYNDTLEVFGLDGGVQTSVGPVDTINVYDAFKFQYKTSTYSNQTSGTYQVKSYVTLTTENIDQYLWNDTVSRTEYYRDFYAYDDGGAEYGFGIAGEDAYNTAFASEFEPYLTYNTSDTLTGVYIYFNMTADLYTADMEFQVAVWDYETSKTGTNTTYKPGDVIYYTDEDNLYTPDTTIEKSSTQNSTDAFMRIDFDEDVLISDRFYIGIIQYTDEFLNVGYDLSNDSKDKTWYFSDNSWTSIKNLQSIPSGSLMIRPIFDHYEYTSSVSNASSITSEITLYPNPTQDVLNINTDIEGSLKARIYNTTGQLVYDQDNIYESIDLNQLPHGLYIINLYNQSNKRIHSQRILKK